MGVEHRIQERNKRKDREADGQNQVGEVFFCGVPQVRFRSDGEAGGGGGGVAHHRVEHRRHVVISLVVVEGRTTGVGAGPEGVGHHGSEARLRAAQFGALAIQHGLRSPWMLDGRGARSPAGDPASIPAGGGRPRSSRHRSRPQFSDPRPPLPSVDPEIALSASHITSYLVQVHPSAGGVRVRRRRRRVSLVQSQKRRPRTAADGVVQEPPFG
mmetsp:Transcript_25945/g.51720  ORF Transcript_25945/g.51720 Transcript_25945/m.51720 type:complete len:213 (-) Transcript_25945:288-926(-)